MTIDPRWITLGRSGNATFMLADPCVIVVAPDEGCTDDETTARQSISFQQAYWRSQGTMGAAVVLMDRVAHQTKEARRVYQGEVDPSILSRFALVSSSVFGRAVASVFMGLARPIIPTRMFGSVAPALAWAKGDQEAQPGSREGGDAA